MDERAKVVELLREYDTAMLVTHDHSVLEARPMQMAQVDDDGRVWFFTDDRTRKVERVTADRDVLLVLQDDRSSYVSLSGTARVVHDREKAARLWTKAYEVWFPDGLASPHLVLIAVEPRAAEYWDNRGTKGVKYLFQAASALITDSRPEIEEGEQHGRLLFSDSPDRPGA